MTPGSPKVKGQTWHLNHAYSPLFFHLADARHVGRDASWAASRQRRISIRGVGKIVPISCTDPLIALAAPPSHSPTPQRPDRTCVNAPPDLATATGTSVTLSMTFRGSIAWLNGSLSTLKNAEALPTRCKTRFRVRVYALSGRRGDRVCYEKFQRCVSHMAFSFRELLLTQSRFPVRNSSGGWQYPCHALVGLSQHGGWRPLVSGPI